MRVFGLHPATLAATCLLVLGGCGGVTFEEPLSDEKTTEVDERLVGFWEVVATSIGEEEPGPGELWTQIAVGRAKAGGKGMEAAALEVEDGVVDVQRLEVWPTTIGEHRYLSLRNPEEAEHGWFVIQYTIEAENELRVRVLDPEACAKSVDAGEIEGEAKGPDRGHEVVSLTVEITAGTDAVRAWIEKRGDSLFTAKTVSLRRLVRKSSSESTETMEPEPPAPPDPLPDEVPDEEPDEVPDEAPDAPEDGAASPGTGR